MVEFSLIAILMTAIFVAVLQVGIYLHQRNVVAASVQAAARWAANANVATEAGGPRAKELIGEALSERAAAGLDCSASEAVGAAGLREVVIRCTGSIPSVATALGDLLPLDVTGRAVKEGQ